jgi:hypothetical protein
MLSGSLWSTVVSAATAVENTLKRWETAIAHYDFDDVVSAQRARAPAESHTRRAQLRKSATNVSWHAAQHARPEDSAPPPHAASNVRLVFASATSIRAEQRARDDAIKARRAAQRARRAAREQRGALVSARRKASTLRETAPTSAAGAPFAESASSESLHSTGAFGAGGAEIDAEIDVYVLRDE